MTGIWDKIDWTLVAAFVAMVITNIMQNRKVSKKVDPVIKLQEQLLATQKTLVQALNDNKVTTEEAAEIYDQVIKAIESAKDAFGASEQKGGSEADQSLT